jgi:hypothetical protein
MKVGDLVSLKMKKTQPPQVPRHGVVLNTWRNHKGKTIEVEIMWSGAGGIISARFRQSLFEVISESR